MAMDLEGEQEKLATKKACRRTHATNATLFYIDPTIGSRFASVRV
jgi:hypothetical protein